MKIGVDRHRCWNSSEVSFSIGMDGHKNIILRVGRQITRVGVVGEEESAWELRLDWRNQGGEGSVLSVKRGNPPRGGVWVGMSLAGGVVGRDRSGGSVLWSLHE
ncbi:hypothetical protein AVEN_146020-1 [Araneus ventricosus]|uniref:Uncharacterized protein n=1 Tax=Araneus ventricosus TaxID=182803 RepID=A0A4Y2SGE0_ARAVE|nr:hypothetical protein AVEN_146020-1 [Araneus ventricosus]